MATFFLIPIKLGSTDKSEFPVAEPFGSSLRAYSIRPYIVFFNWRNVILINQALQGIVDSIDKERNAKKTPEGVQQGISLW